MVPLKQLNDYFILSAISTDLKHESNRLKERLFEYQKTILIIYEKLDDNPLKINKKNLENYVDGLNKIITFLRNNKDKLENEFVNEQSKFSVDKLLKGVRKFRIPLATAIDCFEKNSDCNKFEEYNKAIEIMEDEKFKEYFLPEN